MQKSALLKSIKNSYEQYMINKYKYCNNDKWLTIIDNEELASFRFTDTLHITKLQIINCKQLNFVRVPLLLVDLTLNDCALNQINGIQLIVHLKTLNLAHNSITDINPLKNLVELTYLDAQHNQLCKIDTLSYLVNLRELILNNNQIFDVSPLKQLNLRKLYLDHNEIIDGTPLCKFSQSDVSLFNNKILHFRYLKSLNYYYFHKMFRMISIQDQRVPTRDEIYFSALSISNNDISQKINEQLIKLNNISKTSRAKILRLSIPVNSLMQRMDCMVQYYLKISGFF
ncbi:leucine_Rich Repeat (LRR)-containing protein [Hexamita inflata]|uniref:Leucine Rich Repeat (LRR)-containing protein n=1 Tax=Hexamita inflata TaxID=28002 RepID=A0AA86NKW5_9EUKA|nr:leucine Rich Repeat (LRR)-containing protein [Hexamita inflata]